VKTKFVKCLLLLVSITITLSAQVRYVRNIPIQIPDWAFTPKYAPKQIYPSPDGGMIILGDCEAYWGNPDAPMLAADCGAIKLDAYGNCQWQWWSRNFVGSGFTSIVGIDQETNGRINFIINNSPDYNQIGWIDPQQNFFLQEIQLPTLCRLNRAVRLSDNSIYTIGYAQTTPHFTAVFMHLNAQGDTLSTRSYSCDSLWIEPAAKKAEAFDMELDSDGMPVSTCLFSDRFASIVKTDWSGNLIWRRNTIYQTIGYPFPVTKDLLTEDLFFGYTTTISNLCNQMIIYKITNTGLDSLFTVQVADIYCAGIYHSMIGYCNEFYLSGNINFQARITSCSLTGHNLWSWSLDAGLNTNFDQSTESLTVLPDSCIMHVYGSNEFANYGLTVVKLHPDGTHNEDDYFPKPKFEISIYPNPMFLSAHIALKSGNNLAMQTISASIYNIKGQFIKKLIMVKKSINEFESSWDGYDSRGNACPSGTYLIKIQTENSQIHKKVVLIR